MDRQFDTLFSVAFTHPYFGSKPLKGITAEPLAETERLLRDNGLLFRSKGSGFIVATETKPQSSPLELRYGPWSESLRFSFALKINDPGLAGITKLPNWAPAKSIFYLNNLREEIVSSQKMLGDSKAGQRWGNAIPVVGAPAFIHKLNSPVNTATFTLTDVFNKTYPLSPDRFTFSTTADTSDEFHVSLSNVPGLKPGRYTLTDSYGGSTEFYYGPSLAPDTLAVVEIYLDTNDFTQPSANLVPSNYQLLNGAQLSANRSYTVGFESESLFWEYVLEKGSTSKNTFYMNNLNIQSSLPFPANPTINANKARFRSTSTIESRIEGYEIALRHNAKKLMDLPNPSPSSLIQQDNGGRYIEQFIFL